MKLRNRRDEINFGQYREWTVQEVLIDDPQYLEWLMDNTNKTDFDIDLIHAIQQRALKKSEFQDRIVQDRYDDMDIGDLPY